MATSAPTKRMSPADRRSAIVAATVDVARRKGLASTTVRDVAAEMGTSSGLIHHYFDNKQQLFLATVSLPPGLPDVLEHIRATPGWEERDWPPPEGMSAEENLRDLERHAADFAARRGFTYTVLAPDGDVIGCVYIYPAQDGEHDAHVRSWVSAAAAELDAPLHAAVSSWLIEQWPFERLEYAERD